MAKEETPLPGIRPGEGRSARYILEGGGASAMEDLALTPEERRAVLEKRRKEEARRAKARERMQARSGRRIELDLSEDLKERLEGIAASEGVTVSSVATALLYEGLSQVGRGVLNLRRWRKPSGGGRYHFVLVHPEDKRRAEMAGGESADSDDKESGNALGSWGNWHT